MKILFFLALRPVILFALLLSAFGSNPAWMAQIDPARNLSDLLIPGTHDSGATHDPCIFRGTTACQTNAIAEQLNMGVRFLDIRCKERGGAFFIYHGCVYQNLTFESVLADCQSFLDAHPTETIIMSVQGDGSAAFEDVLDRYVNRRPDRWRRDASLPTLGEARNKIVLLRQFAAQRLPKGIDAAGKKWRKNRAFCIHTPDACLSVQDHYIVWCNRTKWNDIENLFKASAVSDSNCLYLNFTSGFNPIVFWPSIKHCTRAIHPRLQRYFDSLAAENGRRPRGVVIMDFCDPTLCQAIIQANQIP